MKRRKNVRMNQRRLSSFISESNCVWINVTTPQSGWKLKIITASLKDGRMGVKSGVV